MTHSTEDDDDDSRVTMPPLASRSSRLRRLSCSMFDSTKSLRYSGSRGSISQHGCGSGAMTQGGAIIDANELDQAEFARCAERCVSTDPGGDETPRDLKRKSFAVAVDAVDHALPAPLKSRCARLAEYMFREPRGMSKEDRLTEEVRARGSVARAG
eukprot:733824-Prymnesium_polylepis.1